MSSLGTAPDGCMQIAYFIVCGVLTQDVGGFGSLTIQKEQLRKTLHFAGEWVQ